MSVSVVLPADFYRLSTGAIKFPFLPPYIFLIYSLTFVFFMFAVVSEHFILVRVHFYSLRSRNCNEYFKSGCMIKCFKNLLLFVFNSNDILSILQQIEEKVGK